MSTTKFKNAARVWKAVCRLAVGEGLPMPRHWMTVKDVADISGMSKPTCRKYLELAVEQDAASKWVAPSGLVMYRPHEEV